MLDINPIVLDQIMLTLLWTCPFANKVFTPIPGCGGDGVFATAVNDDDRRRQRRRSAPSTTTVGAVGSITTPPPSTTTVDEEDRLANERWVGAITAGQGRRHHHYVDGTLDLPFRCAVKSANQQSN